MSYIRRKEAVSVGEAMMAFLRQARLNSGLNNQRIFTAWDQVSGAEKYTVRRFYRNGILYVTLASSAARTHLSRQKEQLLERINAVLSQDPLFDREDPSTGYVKEIRLK